MHGVYLIISVPMIVSDARSHNAVAKLLLLHKLEHVPAAHLVAAHAVDHVAVLAAVLARVADHVSAPLGMTAEADLEERSNLLEVCSEPFSILSDLVRIDRDCSNT